MKADARQSRGLKPPATVLPWGQPHGSGAWTLEILLATAKVPACLPPWRSHGSSVAGGFNPRLKARRVVFWAIGLLALAACRQDMHNQPRLRPYKVSHFFADGQASRRPPAGTVARGELREDDLLYRGLTPEGAVTERLPFPLTAEVLHQGQQSFNAFCSPCHDSTGGGRGMVVRRGFKQPASFHDERLRLAPVGYFYDVMSNGFATMPSYAAQIPVERRWAITAYIRALQLSQNAQLAEMPAEVATAVHAAETAKAAPPAGRGSGMSGEGH